MDAGLGTRILIVDDHPSFRSSARLLLESEGFEVVGEAATGDAALEQARALEPDVVLLDVQLPDRNGFEVSRLLTDGNGATVILTSSRDSDDFGPLVPGCGARGFVAKAELSGAKLRALLES